MPKLPDYQGLGFDFGIYSTMQQNHKKIIGLLLFWVLGHQHVWGQAGLSLHDAVRLAKTNNSFLKVEKFNADIAQSDVTTAQLRPNPNLNNQSLQMMNSQRFATGTEAFSNQNRQVWWQLTKPIQSPSLRRNKIAFAQEKVKNTELFYLEKERNLAFDVANKWLDVWRIQKHLEMLQKAVGNIDSLVITNTIRLKNEFITTTEFTRTQLIKQQYDIQISSAQQDLYNETKNLQLLLGVNENLQINTADSSEVFGVASKIDTLLNFTLANRTDLRAAQSTINVAKQNESLQKSLKLAAPEVGFIWNPQNTLPYFGVFATWALPIFSKNQGEIQKSKVLSLQSEQNLAALQQKAENELNTSYQSYQRYKQNLVVFRDILEKSDKVLSSVRYAYRTGGTTIIDFLEAQRSWFDTRQLYYDASENYRRSYIQLLYSTGLITKL